MTIQQENELLAAPRNRKTVKNEARSLENPFSENIPPNRRKRGLCRVFGLVCVMAAALAAGCGGNQPSPSSQSRPLEAEVLYRAADCGPPAGEPGVAWIDSRRKLEAFFSQPVAGPGPRPPSLPAWAADFDFSRYRILLVSMGRQPSAGYRLQYVPERSRQSGRTAKVALRRITPPPGAAAAQVITRPCIMIRLGAHIANCELVRLEE